MPSRVYIPQGSVRLSLMPIRSVYLLKVQLPVATFFISWKCSCLPSSDKTTCVWNVVRVKKHDMGSGFCKVRSLKEPVEQNSVTIYVILERNQTCLSVDVHWLCQTHFDFAFNSDFQFLAKKSFCISFHHTALMTACVTVSLKGLLITLCQQNLAISDSDVQFHLWLDWNLSQWSPWTRTKWIWSTGLQKQIVKLNINLLKVARCCPWVHNPYSGLPSFRGQLKTLNF